MNILKSKTLFQDIFFPLSLAVIGAFLIGYYLNYEYLLTGYQDWIYHAFRIKSISEYGITSWDHKWANGINYWQVYQYIPHLLALVISKIASVSAAKAIMILTVSIFVYLRVAGYLALRTARIKPIYSFFAMCLTFLFPQEYIVMQDVSIYFSLLMLPVFFITWVKATRNHMLYILVAGLAGFSWSMHPVLGLTLSGLVFLDLIFNRKTLLMHKLSSLFLFLISSASFYVEYFTIPYKFSLPLFSTVEFISLSFRYEYFGFGILWMILLIASWLIFLLRSRDYEYWAKIILVYTTFVIVVFKLSASGMIPSIFRIFQFQRANVIIGFLAFYLFSMVFQAFLPDLKSIFKRVLIAAGIAIILTSAIDLGTRSAWVTNSYSNSVANYFSDKDPRGSVYYENESELSYFSNNELRLVGSYNEHLLPGPSSYLFKKLLRPNVGYTEITDSQIDLIEDYMNVLGVEYLVLPYNSPIARKERESDIKFLEVEGEITNGNFSYLILKNINPIYYAYIVDYKRLKTEVGDDIIDDPTLNVRSVSPWNELVMKYSSFLRNENAIPLEVKFIYPNKLEILLPSSLPEMQEPVVLLAQSYDKNWNSDLKANISPTNLRFIKLVLLDAKPGQKLTLTNNWPSWHWPIEALAPLSVLLSSFYIGIYSLIKKGRNENK